MLVLLVESVLLTEVFIPHRCGVLKKSLELVICAGLLTFMQNLKVSIVAVGAYCVLICDADIYVTTPAKVLLDSYWVWTVPDCPF